MTPTRRRLIPLLVAAGLLATACGSTVPAGLREQALQSPGLSGGLGPGTGLLPSGSPIQSGGALSPGGFVPGGNTSAPGPGGSFIPGTAAAAAGITATTIYVGMLYSQSGPANQAAFGVSLDADARKAYNAMIDIVNEAGGILGRKVVPLYYKIDATSTQTIDEQAQAACAYWTRDNKVFAMLIGGEVLQQCAKDAGAIQPVPAGASLPEDFVRYPAYLEISGLNLIRVGPLTVTGLDKLGYFDGDVKLGVVVWDRPEYHASLDHGFIPALEDIGIELAAPPEYISAPQSFQDLAATAADVNNAVLTFDTLGITHVMILDGPAGLCAGACLGTLFLRRAEQQDYFPRYGFNGNNGPRSAQASNLYPTSQLRRSLVVEWDDSDAFADEGWKLNQRRETCYKMMRDRGVPMTNVNELYFARSACEQFWFIQMVIDKLNGATLTTSSFMAAVNTIGWGFQSPSAYAVHLDAQQHDGVAAARNMRFVDACDCYRWTGPPYRI